MSNPSAPSPNADLALTVFLQDVASGRRVLWIGDASTGGAERLASMALDVRVMDTSGRLRAGKVGAARVVPYSAGRLELDGQFDLVVVPDASVLEDLSQSSEEIKRALGDGLLVLGTQADTEHYERAVPALDAAFREVRLLGQAPLTASAIANLDHEAGGVAFDDSLLRNAPEDIERYLFVAGDELPENDGLLVVQLPGTQPAESNEREVQALRQELNRAGARLEQAQVRLVETEATLSEARARLVSQEAAAEAAVAEAEARATQAEALSREAAQVPPPVALVEDIDDGEDIIALEHKLQERGAQVRSLQSEARRHALIVRDMAEELREWTRGHRGAPATDSALDTEASLAAAQFTIDELSAEVVALKSAASSAAPAPVASAPPAADPASAAPASAAPDPALTEELAQAKRAAETLEGERNGLALRLSDIEASLEAARSTNVELRSEVAELQAAPAPEPSPDPAVAELAEARTQLEALEGERNGLTLRLADVEASLEAASAPPAPAAAVSPSTDQLDRLDALQEEVEMLRRTNTELTISTLDLSADKEALETRGREVSSALAARDALITRLQIDLAQEENTRALHDKQVVRMRDEVFNLREAVVAASLAVDARERAERKVAELEAELKAALANSAAADLVELAQQEAEELSDELREVAEARDAAAARLGQVEGELGALRDHASAAEETVAGLEAFKAKATEALGAARATLAALQDQGFTPERSSITSAGGELAPTSEADAGLETLMRSLTAQLEERDDRIRALERRVRDGGGSTSNTDALELEERADRLQEALEHERAARSLADERVIQLLKQAPVEPVDLKQKLSAKESALEETEQRVETLSVDVSSLRTVCAETRSGLESLLSDADADEEAARRIGELLDILRGF
ncbi:MAG: hypothetical protein AB8H86_14340 [Polyangiales bacterium]